MALGGAHGDELGSELGETTLGIGKRFKTLGDTLGDGDGTALGDWLGTMSSSCSGTTLGGKLVICLATAAELHLAVCLCLEMDCLWK